MTRDDLDDYREVVRTSSHQTAPKKEQIKLIMDNNTIVDILDGVENSIIAIKARLKYSNNDDQSWRNAAISALIYNKIAEKNLKKRLSELNAMAKAGAIGGVA